MILIHSFVPKSPGWPINKNGSSDYILRGKKAPDMTIKTVVSVIAQYKHGIPWNGNWSELVFGIFISVWLVLQITIDIKLPAFHFNFIALRKRDARETPSLEELYVLCNEKVVSHLYCNNSFDQSLFSPRLWLTILVYKDITKGLRWIENDNLLSIQWFDSLSNLFNGELVSDVKRWIHGKTWNKSWLNNRKSKCQGDCQTEKVSLYVFSAFVGLEPTLKLLQWVFVFWWLR